MPTLLRLVAALSLLTVLVPVPAMTRPPERLSGRMVLDEVSEGLRKYRRETHKGQRIAWLRRLAPSRDPRVALELWDAFAWVRGKRTAAVRAVARDCLAEYYATKDGRPLAEVAQPDWERAGGVCSWWSANAADVRRRASQLPR
jgi:hypothetical protein